MDGWADRQTDGQMGGLKTRQTVLQAGRQEGRKAGRQEGRKAGRQEGRKAGRQIDKEREWEKVRKAF